MKRMQTIRWLAEQLGRNGRFVAGSLFAEACCGPAYPGGHTSLQPAFLACLALSEVDDTTGPAERWGWGGGDEGGGGDRDKWRDRKR